MRFITKNKSNKVDMENKGHDKQWAHKYINEPLTAPEPFQELGRAYSARKQFTISCPAINRLSTGRYPSNTVLDDFKLYPSATIAKQILNQVASDACSIAPTMATASSSSQHRRVVSAGSNTHRDSGEGRILDTIKRETRMADRRHRKRFSNADIIDRLDMSGLGPAYHHEGPYDAALAGYNMRKKYSPLEAVRNSNREAIQATPREYMRDCLDKHYPLQGTATIPPGSFDSHGNLMTYREGADLMREPDAEGGAYRRYEGVKYHPDDLKGKGEPSFTLERDLKLRERKMLPGKGNEVEMQTLLSDGVPRTVPDFEQRAAARHNQKDSSVAQVSGYANEDGDAAGPSGEGVKRRLSNGIRKRFGSIKRKVLSEEPTAA